MNTTYFCYGRDDKWQLEVRLPQSRHLVHERCGRILSRVVVVGERRGCPDQCFRYSRTPQTTQIRVILGLASQGFWGVLRNDSPATIALGQCLEAERNRDLKLEVPEDRGALSC